MIVRPEYEAAAEGPRQQPQPGGRTGLVQRGEFELRRPVRRLTAAHDPVEPAEKAVRLPARRIECAGDLIAVLPEQPGRSEHVALDAALESGAAAEKQNPSFFSHGRPLRKDAQAPCR